MDNKVKIMYVRVSENCNSKCFMCHYAGTKNSYNITDSQYNSLLSYMKDKPFKMIRFTGGEPLLHKDICKYIRRAKENYKDDLTNEQIAEKVAKDLEQDASIYSREK